MKTGCQKTSSSKGLKGKTKLFPVNILLAIPITLLIVAYIHMSFLYEKFWLFDTVIHENGRYTLLEVLFYFRHFSWEILGKAIYSIFIVGAFYYYGKPFTGMQDNPPWKIPVGPILLSGFFVLGIITFTILMNASKLGLKETCFGFLQFRTSETKPLEFGSHWRNHFLSNIVLFSTSAVSVVLYRIVSNGNYWIKRKFSILMPTSIATFIVLSFLFGFSKDTFETPSYLGHQLREIFGSDLSVTMFLTLAILIYLERNYDSVGGNREAEKQKDKNKKRFLHVYFWSFPLVFIVGFLIVKVLSLDMKDNIAKLGSTANWSIPDLFAWHFYEHFLDYLFVISFVCFLYLLTLRMELKKNTR